MASLRLTSSRRRASTSWRAGMISCAMRLRSMTGSTEQNQAPMRTATATAPRMRRRSRRETELAISGRAFPGPPGCGAAPGPARLAVGPEGAAPGRPGSGAAGAGRLWGSPRTALMRNCSLSRPRVTGDENSTRSSRGEFSSSGIRVLAAAACPLISTPLVSKERLVTQASDGRPVRQLAQARAAAGGRWPRAPRWRPGASACARAPAGRPRSRAPAGVRASIFR